MVPPTSGSQPGRQVGTASSSLLRAQQDGASLHTDSASRCFLGWGWGKLALWSWLSYRVAGKPFPFLTLSYPSTGARVLPALSGECHGKCSGRESGDHHMWDLSPSPLFPLDRKLPFLFLPSPVIFVLVFWQLQHLRQESEKEDSPSYTSDPDLISSPPCPQVSSKDMVDSLCPNSVKKL